MQMMYYQIKHALLCIHFQNSFNLSIGCKEVQNHCLILIIV